MPAKKNVGKRRSQFGEPDIVIPEFSDIQKEEALYMHSFVDPHHPSRGPNNIEHPTVLVTLHANEAITVATPTVAGTNWPTTFVGVAAEGYHMNSSGNIGFLLGTICGAEATAASSTSSVFPMATFDPDLNWNTPLQGSADPRPAGQASGSPFGSWDIDLPGTLTNLAATPAKSYSSLHKRSVGIRAEIESTTNRLDEQGYIYGGDLGHLMASPAARGAAQCIAGYTYQTQMAEQRDYNDLLPLDRGDVTSNNRLCTCGPVKLGEHYEAVYIPTSDNVLPYVTALPNFELGTIGQGIAAFPANEPMLAFIIKGLDTTKTYSFRIGLTCSYEIPCEKKSDVGLLFAHARYANRFVPNWTMMSHIKPSGDFGSVHRGWLSTKEAVIGHAVLAGAIAAPKTYPPHKMGVSTTSTTKQVLGHVGTVAKQLGMATATALAPAAKKAAHGWFMKFLGKAEHALVKFGMKAGPKLLRAGEAVAPLAIAAL